MHLCKLAATKVYDEMLQVACGLVSAFRQSDAGRSIHDPYCHVMVIK